MSLFDFFRKPKKEKPTASESKQAMPTMPTGQAGGRQAGPPPATTSSGVGGGREEVIKAKRKKEARKEIVSSQKKVSKTKDALGLVKLKESKTAWRILAEPHVTEKSTDLVNLNQYTFKIFDSATKPEVRRAVREIYGVHVEGVRKIKVARKERKRSVKRSRQVGWRSGYTKAIVTLRKGEKIEVLPH